MARKKREVSKTGIYHILLRGVNSLFLRDNDFETFLSILKEKTKGKNVKILAYLLLENRVHIVIDVKNENVGTVLKPICTSYARYCNRTRAMSGKLFYDRFKSEPINSKNELLEAVAFINFVANINEGAKFSSSKNPFCTPKESGLTEEQAKSTKFTRLFMEDYDCLSKSELISYIHAICGVLPKDFKALSEKKQGELIDEITKEGRISKSKAYEVFGAKRHKEKSLEIKKKEDTDKADMSVWLL